MMRWLGSALCALALAAAARPAAAFLFVSGSNGGSGDLVAVWVKNSYEMIVNLGPVEQLGNGGTLSSFNVPSQFGGSLVGAKFVALAVPNPDAAYTNLGFDPPPPQPNIALTTLGDPTTITPNQVGDAQAVLDTPTSGQTWLQLLGTVGAGGTTGVVSNTDSELLIQTSLFASYTNVLGFASDAIANTITLSTAVVVAAGQGYSIPLYEVFQTLAHSGQDYVFGTRVTPLGVLGGDDGSSGLAMLNLQPAPEPMQAALGACALGALGWLARRRRRRAA